MAKIIIVIAISICWIGHGQVQGSILQKRVTLKAEYQSLVDVLNNISSKCDVDFSYDSKIVKSIFFNTIDLVDLTLDHVFYDLLNDHSLSYEEKNGVIIIYKKATEKTSRLKKKEIYGYLTDKDTGKPIADVNVFISNTTIGTSTSKDGFYRISTANNNISELVFTHIGYFPVIKIVQMASSEEMELSLEMTEKINTLKEVVIKESKEEWEKYLKIFEREFLGTTTNSKGCKILNPWVLNFDYDPKTDHLKATSQDLLIVQNVPLGYKISYLIELFEFQKGRAKFLTKNKYEEILEKNKSKKKKLAKRRKETFLGSFEHFIQALSNHDLYNQGFRIALVDSFLDNRTRSVVESMDIMQRDGKEQQIIFSGFLEVAYQDAEEDAHELVSSIIQIFRPQTSFLEINPNQAGIVISDGKLKNPMSVIQHGYWSLKRTADMLPTDFKLSENSIE